MSGGRGDSAASLRIDKLLWYLRLVKSRDAAQGLVARGIIRLDGRRVEKASAPVRVGAVLVLPVQGGVRALSILSLPSRRGPAVEAAAHYRDAALPEPATDEKGSAEAASPA